MSYLRLIAGLAWLVLLLPAGAGAAQSDAAAPLASETPGLDTSVGPVSACPALDLQSREAVQADCCQGHMGVCGCRAGKIVCCDATASRTCTCHAASPPDPDRAPVE